MTREVSEGSLLWEPSEEVVANARVTRFARWLSDRGVLTENLRRPVALVRHRGGRVLGLDLGLLRRRRRARRRARPGGRAHARGRAELVPRRDAQLRGNALRPRGRTPARTAVVARGEEARHRTLTYAELAAEVARVRAGLAAWA